MHKYQIVWVAAFGFGLALSSRSEAQDFSYDPANRGFFHRTLRLRVSRQRLHSLVRDTLKD